MPRVKELNPRDKRKAIILYCLAYKGWSDSRLEKELGIGHSARAARMKDVGKFSLDEVTKIIHNVQLSPGLVSTVLGGIDWDLSGVEMSVRGML